MILTGAEDLRVIKSIESIKAAYGQLLSEKEPGQVTVTALCELARINKKTFYRYYSSLEDLMDELSQEITQKFMARIKNCTLPEDLEAFNENYLHYASEQDAAFEKFACSMAVAQVRQTLMGRMVRECWSRSEKYQRLNTLEKGLVESICGTTILRAYQLWVQEGKTRPLDEVIKTANRMVRDGLRSVFPG